MAYNNAELQVWLAVSLGILMINSFAISAEGREIARASGAITGDLARHPQSNFRPIIGVLSQPGDFAEEGSSYIAASYVKWIEASGARVAPIFYDMSYDELDSLFYKLNGILIPGGGAVLEPGNTFFDTASYLLDLTLKANDKGDFFPFWGTCLGLEVLGVAVSGNTSLLVETDAENLPSPLHFTAEAVGSRLVPFLGPQITLNMASHPLTMQNHEFGMSTRVWKENGKLSDFFRVIATASDRNHMDYVAVMEGRSYPVYALSFHPEKILFEWTPALAIPHSDEAVEMSHRLSRFFVSEARRNKHKCRDIVEEDAIAIYNYPPVFSGKHEHVDDNKFFEQIYLFESVDRRA